MYLANISMLETIQEIRMKQLFPLKVEAAHCARGVISAREYTRNAINVTRRAVDLFLADNDLSPIDTKERLYDREELKKYTLARYYSIPYGGGVWETGQSVYCPGPSLILAGARDKRDNKKGWYPVYRQLGGWTYELYILALDKDYLLAAPIEVLSMNGIPAQAMAHQFTTVEGVVGGATCDGGSPSLTNVEFLLFNLFPERAGEDILENERAVFEAMKNRHKNLNIFFDWVQDVHGNRNDMKSPFERLHWLRLFEKQAGHDKKNHFSIPGMFTKSKREERYNRFKVETVGEGEDIEYIYTHRPEET